MAANLLPMLLLAGIVSGQLFASPAGAHKSSSRPRTRPSLPLPLRIPSTGGIRHRAVLVAHRAANRRPPLSRRLSRDTQRGLRRALTHKAHLPVLNVC